MSRIMDRVKRASLYLLVAATHVACTENSTETEDFTALYAKAMKYGTLFEQPPGEFYMETQGRNAGSETHHIRVDMGSETNRFLLPREGYSLTVDLITRTNGVERHTAKARYTRDRAWEVTSGDADVASKVANHGYATLGRTR